MCLLVLFRKTTVMVFLYALALIFCIIALPCVSSAERRVFCSSEYCNIWYSYEGPLYYLSLTGSPCSPKVAWNVITYTVVPMFTVARAGYHAQIYFKGQLWLDFTQPDIPCEDIKACYIIKGETLQETCPIYLKRSNLLTPQGEYQIYMDVNIVDHVERRLTIRFNITIEIKGTGSKMGIF